MIVCDFCGQLPERRPRPDLALYACACGDMQVMGTSREIVWTCGGHGSTSVRMVFYHDGDGSAALARFRRGQYRMAPEDNREAIVARIRLRRGQHLVERILKS